LWPSPLGQLWGVVGELDSGLRLVITCMPAGSGFRLHISPAIAREWLLDTLAQNGAGDVSVVTDPLDQPPPTPGTPWIALSLGLGAIALFGWVISSIVR
jgi:hypothetical protein